MIIAKSDWIFELEVFRTYHVKAEEGLPPQVGDEIAQPSQEDPSLMNCYEVLSVALEPSGGWEAEVLLTKKLKPIPLKGLRS